jgi:hypothetical protein
MSTDTIALLANIALALSFVVGLVFGIAQVRTAARDRKERLTLETLRNYQSPEFSELIFKVNAYNIPSTLEQWQKLPDGDLIMFLQFTQAMESLGILVADRFINIDLVDKTLGSFVTSSWGKFKMVIADIREKRGDIFLGEYYQWLAERLDERMKMNPRKPFHEANNKNV